MVSSLDHDEMRGMKKTHEWRGRHSTPCMIVKIMFMTFHLVFHHMFSLTTPCLLEPRRDIWRRTSTQGVKRREWGREEHHLIWSERSLKKSEKIPSYPSFSPLIHSREGFAGILEEPRRGWGMHNWIQILFWLASATDSSSFYFHSCL